MVANIKDILLNYDSFILHIISSLMCATTGIWFKAHQVCSHCKCKGNCISRKGVTIQIWRKDTAFYTPAGWAFMHMDNDALCLDNDPFLNPSSSALMYNVMTMITTWHGYRRVSMSWVKLQVAYLERVFVPCSSIYILPMAPIFQALPCILAAVAVVQASSLRGINPERVCSVTKLGTTYWLISRTILL